MSQAGRFASGSTPPIDGVETLTGNTGGAVGPTLGNINVIGAGTITVTGNPGTSTLTISTSSTGGADTFDADVGSAAPVAGVINIVGSSNIHTTASGNTVEVILDDDVLIAGSFTAGATSGFITSVTGDITAQAGNFILPNTLSTGAEGVVVLGTTPFLHNFGLNTFVGGAGNLTLTPGVAVNNTGVGNGSLDSITIGTNNTSIGFDSQLVLTSGIANTSVGSNALVALQSGSGNAAYGAGAGGSYLTTESFNIVIGNPGVAADQNTIRIGVSGSGTLEQDKAYMAGIYSSTSLNVPRLVTIGNDDRLGTIDIDTYASTFPTDSGIATAAGGIVDVLGGSNINTAGATNVITINLDNTVSISGSFTAGTISGSITAQTGNIVATAGNLLLPSTNSGGTQGVILIGGNTFAHKFGTNNLFVGETAGNTSTVSNSENTGLGDNSLHALTSGFANTCVGSQCGQLITTTGQNCAFGQASYRAAVTGTGNNSCFGWASLVNITTGAHNVAFGALAGSNYTGSESSNILIGSQVLGTVAESNTTRIGVQGSGTGQQNRCFISGITGVTTTNTNFVTINTATGQLGAMSGNSSGIIWSVVTGATALVAGHGYMVNGSSKLQFTLPAIASLGDTFEILVLGPATGTGWKVNQNAGQNVVINLDSPGGNTILTTTTGTGGSIETKTGAPFGAAKFVCAVANTTFIMSGGIGISIFTVT